MKRSILIVAVMSLTLAATSQTVLYQDDFESYSPGDYLAKTNPDWWSTWSNLPGTGEDIAVADNNADSGIKSALITWEDGITDALLKLGDKTNGVYELDWNMYIESGFGAYYNLQHFESPGVEWAFEIYFYSDGNGVLNAGNNSFSFIFPHDSWFPVNHLFNIDEDQARLFIDNKEVSTWPLHYEISGTEGTKQLGAIDFNDASGYKYYIDDVKYEMIPTQSYYDDFESYRPGSYMAVSNSYRWTTWTEAPGTGEDVVISDDQASSGNYSAYISWEDGITDALLKLGDKTSGVYQLDWNMYIESGYGAYYNLQHFESPGVEFAFEIYFYIDGTGEFRVGSSSYFFSFPHDTWIPVSHIFNLDEDQATLSVNNEDIHTWPFHYNIWSTEGTNQLGAVNFNDGENFRYYLDDIEYDSLDMTGIWSNYLRPDEIRISVYPNPATDNLSVTSDEELKEIEIFDNVGRLIFKQDLLTNSINLDISRYNSGVYHLRAKSNTGTSTTEFIIQ